MSVCLLLSMQAGAQNWSKVNLNDQLAVQFPIKPSIESTQVGPQAQAIQNEDAKFTTLEIDMIKAGVDSATIKRYTEAQFRNFATNIARRGGVDVKKAVNGQWDNKYRAVFVTGTSQDRDVSLQFLLVGSKVIVMGYSATPAAVSSSDRRKFFTSIEYKPVQNDVILTSR